MYASPQKRNFLFCIPTRRLIIKASPVWGCVADPGEVSAQLTEGLYRDNPPVFAYAKTAPFAQGSLICSKPPLCKGRWRGEVAPEGLLE